MVNPFSLSGLRLTNLRMLGFLAKDQQPRGFWEPVLRACQKEEHERTKPEAERIEVVFELPTLPPDEAAIARNELGLMITRLRGSTDDRLVLLLAASAKGLGAQLESAAARN